MATTSKKNEEVVEEKVIAEAEEAKDTAAEIDNLNARKDALAKAFDNEQNEARAIQADIELMERLIAAKDKLNESIDKMNQYRREYAQIDARIDQLKKADNADKK